MSDLFSVNIFFLENFWKTNLTLFLFVLRVLSIYEVTTCRRNKNLGPLVTISAWKQIYFREYDSLLPTKQYQATVKWWLDISYCEMFDLTQSYVALFSKQLAAVCSTLSQNMTAVWTIANNFLYYFLHDTRDCCQLDCTEGIVDLRNVNIELGCVVKMVVCMWKILVRNLTV